MLLLSSNYDFHPCAIPQKNIFILVLHPVMILVFCSLSVISQSMYKHRNLDFGKQKSQGDSKRLEYCANGCFHHLVDCWLLIDWHCGWHTLPVICCLAKYFRVPHKDNKTVTLFLFAVASCLGWCYFVFLQLVSRLSQEELMTQLPSFLPALFEAFGNQSPDVRKVRPIFFPPS